MNRKAVVVSAAALCVAAGVCAPLLGPTPIHLSELLDGSLKNNPNRQIVLYARLPRVAGAILAGAGLATSGAVFQAVLRNPLADPFTLGISGGAALGAAVAIRLGLDHVLPAGLLVSLAALAGAMLAVFLVWGLARRGAVVLPATLLLAGVTLSLVTAAVIVLLQYTADLGQGLRIARWAVGSLDGLRWEILVVTAPLCLAAMAIVLLLARPLNALAAGPDIAASVGVDVKRSLTVSYVSSSLLVGMLVALAGPIGFVGLIVPHVARALGGADHRILLPVCALGGAAFLVLCDTASRLLLSGADLPVGIVTALLGGPFFLWLLRRRGGLT